jgi:hypothetical protein
MAAPNRFGVLRSSDPHVSRVQDLISNTLTPVATAVQNSPLMGRTPVWIALAADPAFINLGAPYATLAYYVDVLTRLWTKGVLITSAGVGAGATVATLPPGARPKETQRKSVEGNGGTAQFISIAPTGVCTVELAIAAGGTVDFDFSLLAEQ